MFVLNTVPKRAQVNVHIQLPYSAKNTLPITVAAWNARRGLTLISHLTLFPEKYIR